MEWWEVLVHISGWTFVALLAGGAFWGAMVVAGVLIASMSNLIVDPQQIPDAARVVAITSLFLAPLHRLIFIALPGEGR